MPSALLRLPAILITTKHDGLLCKQHTDTSEHLRALQTKSGNGSIVGRQHRYKSRTHQRSPALPRFIGAAFPTGVQ